MPKSVLYFLLGFGSILLFGFFSYLVHKDLFTQFDFDTTVRLQDNLPRRVDGLFSFFSIVGNFEVMLVLLLGHLIYARKVVAGIVTLGAFGLFHVVELFSKLFVNHPPPPEFMLRTERPFDLPQFHVRAEYSYPSGHSGRTIFLSVLILFFIWKSHLPLGIKLLVGMNILGFNVIMLLSRVYLGEHWTSDVVGGVLLSLGLSFMSLSGYLFSEKRKLI